MTLMQFGSPTEPKATDLIVTEAHASYAGKPNKQILRNGRWLVKKMIGEEEAVINLTVTVKGKGFGVLFAAAQDDGGMQYLATKNITPGIHTLTYRAPYHPLKGFVIGVGREINSRWGMDYLTTQQISRASNRLAFSASAAPYTTSSLGTLQSTEDPDAGVTLPELDFTDYEENVLVPGYEGTKPQSLEYWDGNVGTHNWNRYGFSGSASAKAANVNRPKEVTDAFGCYAMRMSNFVADFDEQGDFNGFKVLKDYKETVAAGTPIATLVQMFVKEVWNMTGAGVLLPFITNTDLKPEWSYANGMKLQPQDFFYVESAVLRSGKIKLPMDALNETMYTKAFKGKSKGFSKKLPRGNLVPKRLGNPVTGPLKKEFAAKLEWYNPSTKRWSEPRQYPPSIPRCSSFGKFVLIYRFPQQLNPATDKIQIRKIMDAGGPDYSYANTKECYPYPTDLSGGKGYGLIGRLQPTNSVDAMAKKFTVEIDGQQYGGRREIRFYPMIRPRNHKKAGYTTDWSRTMEFIFPKLTETASEPYFDSPATGAEIAITDPTKYAYLNNPQVNTVYFKDKKFAPGETFYVIGQALGTTHGDNDRMFLSTDRKMTKTKMRELGITNRKDNPRGGVTNVAGTKKADFIIPEAVITTDDLIDQISVPGEEYLREDVSKMFGVELSPDWFNTPGMSISSPSGSKGQQNAIKRTHYTVPSSFGPLTFPYSIAIFKIPEDWCGPYMELDENGEFIRQNQDVPYRLNKPGDPITYFGFQTPFNQILSQKIDFYKEITQQTEMEEEGFRPDEIFTDQAVDEAAVSVTAEVQTDIQEAGKRGEGPEYTDSYFKANFFNYDNKRLKETIAQRRGHTLKESRFIMGFSEASNFEVEDVTQKWGDLEGIGIDMEMGLSPMGYVGPDSGMFQLGNAGEYAGESLTDFYKETKKIPITAVPKLTLLSTAASLPVGAAGFGLGTGLPIGLALGAAIISYAGWTIIKDATGRRKQ